MSDEHIQEVMTPVDVTRLMDHVFIEERSSHVTYSQEDKNFLSQLSASDSETVNITCTRPKITFHCGYCCTTICHLLGDIRLCKAQGTVPELPLYSVRTVSVRHVRCSCRRQNPVLEMSSENEVPGWIGGQTAEKLLCGPDERFNRFKLDLTVSETQLVSETVILLRDMRGSGLSRLLLDLS